MSRFLFVVPPMAGHVNPTLAVGRELAARGHAVAWTGPDEVVGPLVPGGARFLPTPLSPAVRQAIAARADDLRGIAALKHLVGDFLVPLAECMVPGVRAAVDAFAPDALVVDQQALAGLAVACTSGLPWATSATTSANLDDPLAAVPKVRAWADGLQREVLRSAGVDGATAATVDLRSSPHLVLVFSTRALVGGGDIPDHVACVGPSIAERPGEAPLDPAWLDHHGPRVLVSLGTLNWHNGGRFFATAAEALGDLGAAGIIAAPPEVVGPVPTGVVATTPVPQLALMPHVDAVVCHGGHNTVCEALAHGVPLVVAPIRDDQPTIAEQVVRAGAGVRVMFRRVTPAGLRDAIAAALGDPALRAGARAVQRSFAEAGGAVAAADHLERLPTRPGPTAIRPAGPPRRPSCRPPCGGLTAMPDDALLERAPADAGEVYPVSRNDVYRSVNHDLVAALDLPDDAAVVDLGCGDGMLSRLLLDRHGGTLRIWAVDPDEAMLAGARAALGDRVGVCAGSAETFAGLFPPASCDAVALANSLHLVADRAALYAGVRRVLRPGGLFGLNTSFYENAHTAANGTLALSAYLEARTLAKRRGIDIPPADPRLARTLPPAAALADELRAAAFEVTCEQERSLVMDLGLLQSFVSSPYFAATVFPALDLAVGGALLAEAVEHVTAKRSRPVERAWLTLVARRGG